MYSVRSKFSNLVYDKNRHMLIVGGFSSPSKRFVMWCFFRLLGAKYKFRCKILTVDNTELSHRRWCHHKPRKFALRSQIHKHSHASQSYMKYKSDRNSLSKCYKIRFDSVSFSLNVNRKTAKNQVVHSSSQNCVWCWNYGFANQFKCIICPTMYSIFMKSPLA